MSVDCLEKGWSDLLRGSQSLYVVAAAESLSYDLSVHEPSASQLSYCDPFACLLLSRRGC